MSDFVLILGSGDLLDHVKPTVLFSVGGFDVSNQALMVVVAAVLVVLVFSYVASCVCVRGDKCEDYVTKGNVAQLFEVICVYLRDSVTRPALGKITDKYIGFIWTTFFFVLFCNLLGMVPFGPIARLVGGAVGAEHPQHLTHWGGTATANVNITAGLAVVAFFMIHFVGIREQGIRYFAHFNPGPMFMAPILVPLEIIGSLVKPFALCVRLFANMVAGHLVIAALLGLIVLAGEASAAMGYGVAVAAVLGATAISLLELFVAFLQAYIFTFLTVLFIASGAVHDHDEHDEKHNKNESSVHGAAAI